MNHHSVRAHSVSAVDGTRLSFYVQGKAPPGDSTQRPVVLTNGIGTTENFWRHLLPDLRIDHLVVHWDYRGHGQSDLAASGAYDLETLSSDLEVIVGQTMERSGGVAPIHIAFSMGVPVLFELYRRRPELVPEAVLIAGAPEAPGASRWLLRQPGMMKAFRAGMAALSPAVPLVSPLIKPILTSPLAYRIARSAGVLRDRADREDFATMMRGMVAMDLRAYWSALQGLMRASTWDVVDQWNVPTLIIAASEDPFITVSQMERMHQQMPTSQFLEVKNAGHAGLIEAGPELSGMIHDFLHR